MSELQNLFVLLLVIYVVDCLVFVRRGSLLFRRWGRHWQPLRPHSVLTNTRGHLAFSNPWPGAPSTFAASLPACTLTPSGLLNWMPFSLDDSRYPTPPLTWVPWDQLAKLQVDRRTLLLNGRPFLILNSSHAALQMQETIQGLRRVPAPDRPQAIRHWMQSTLDPDQVARRRKRAVEQARWLTILARVLALLLAVGCPMLIHFLGLPQVGWWLLASIYALSICLTFLVNRTHRRLYPADADDRFVRVFTTGLAPLSAVRCPDLVARESLQGFHPLAVARELCPEEHFRTLAARIYRDAHFPLFPVEPSAEAAIIDALAWSRKEWQAELTRFLSSSGIQPAALLLPPTASDPGNRRYCPRCLQQFNESGLACVECGGRPTVNLDFAAPQSFAKA